MKKILFIAVAAGALLFAGRAQAENMPRLPRPVVLPQSGDSPGVVKFDHSTHVDSAQPKCATCHPGLFSILGRSAERRAAPITHERMEKGETCGACHGKGKKAFDLEDCTMCHAQ